MPNQFFSPEGDLEKYFVTEYWLIDQYIGDTLWVWGRSDYGQLGTNVTINRSTPVTTFAGGTNWKQVSCGSQHTAAIKTDGTLWTWGRCNFGQLGSNDTISRSTPVTTFAGGTNWKQVSCGYRITAAIKTDGTLWTWGEGGRIGINDTIIRSTPVTTFVGGTNWKQVSCGGQLTAAIKTDGTLWVWGQGNIGQLGTNDTISRLTPVTTFAGGTNWKQVSCGGQHTSAIKTDGTLWIWGLGLTGRLGTNDTISRLTPVTTFAGGTNWKQVECGRENTAAIKTDGTLWTCGDGRQLGRLNLTNQALTPITTFAGGTNWANVETDEPEELYTLSAGNNFSSAIKTDGTLWNWGRGTSGQLGTNDTISRFTPVTTFAGGTNWKQVSCGGQHTSAIKTDGTLWTWGLGVSGLLGTNDTINRSTPVTTFAGGTNWKQVSCGGYHVSAIKTDGTLWNWGRGTSGQLGTNDTISRFTPVTTFAGGTNWKQVSCGQNHTAAIKTDGTLWTWGLGIYTILGINELNSKSTPVTTFAGGTNWKQVSCGVQHTAAIKTDGTLWTWGRLNYGTIGSNVSITFGGTSTPVTTFAGGTDWKQVSSGSRHTAAIKTDGTLWIWGRNTNGHLGINDTIDRSTPVTTFAGGTNWKQVSCGGYHTLALRDDEVNKELYVFGNNNDGQIGIFNNSFFLKEVFGSANNWKKVECGYTHIAAIKTDGTLWTWGQGTSGQLGTNDTISRSTPVTTFAGGTDWKQVNCSGYYTAAITSGISPDLPLT